MKVRSAGSREAATASTSSHPTGVEAVGVSRARSEYTQTVVLCSSFWLQSMKTLPGRLAFVISDTIRPGSRRSSTCATPMANVFVPS